MLLGRENELERALESFSEAELLYRSDSRTEGLVETIYQRGALFLALRRYEEASVEFRRALPLAGEYRDQEIRTLRQLSGVARGSGDLDEAEQYARRAVELATDRPRLRANALIDLAKHPQPQAGT